MLQIKIILALVLLAGAGGGYLYVTKLQKDNAILKTNQVKLETAVAESSQVIEQQTKDLKKIRSTLKEIDEQIKSNVDIIIEERISEIMTTPSQIIKIGKSGDVQIIRK